MRSARRVGDYDPDPTQYEQYQWMQTETTDYESGQWMFSNARPESVNPADVLMFINGTTRGVAVSEIPTIEVTSKDVDGPYRINEEDFDAKIHKKVTAEKSKAESTKAEKEAKA